MAKKITAEERLARVQAEVKRLKAERAQLKRENKKLQRSVVRGTPPATPRTRVPTRGVQDIGKSRFSPQSWQVGRTYKRDSSWRGYKGPSKAQLKDAAGKVHGKYLRIGVYGILPPEKRYLVRGRFFFWYGVVVDKLLFYQLLEDPGMNVTEAMGQLVGYGPDYYLAVTAVTFAKGTPDA